MSTDISVNANICFCNKVQDAETACRYTEQIAAPFKGQYQMLTAVHKEDQSGSKFHGQIIMKTVNLNDGKLYHSGRAELRTDCYARSRCNGQLLQILH